MGPLTVTVCLALLGAAATWLVRCAHLRSAAHHLLAVYVMSWALLVLVCAALSVDHHLTRASLTGSLGALALGAYVVWRLRTRPAGRLARRHVSWLLGQLRAPALASLAVVVAAGYAYALALALLTPQNEGDPLVYELARAAFWRQEKGIGVTGADFDPRLDANPVVAEIGELATMVAGGSERYVALGQLSAVAALGLATYCLGRRLGLVARPALFGALVLLTSPVIALQSWTGGNDLVVAAFVVVAAVFVLGETRAELAFAVIATALAVGTKFTGPLALPMLLILVLVGGAGRRVPAVLALFTGVTLGSGWYVANLVRTGDLDGGLAGRFDQSAAGGLGDRVATLMRLTLDSIDGSGAIELYALAYVAAATTLAVTLALRRARRWAFVAVPVVAIAPFAAAALGKGLAWLSRAGWELAGSTETARLFGDWHLSTDANAYTSWYGPVMPLLVAAALVLTIVQSRRSRGRGTAIALAVAPIVMLVVLAVTLAYDETRGRFLIAAIAMSGATWGLIVNARPLACAVAASCLVTFVLVLVNAMAKPSGIQAGQYASSPAVWALPRSAAQTLLRPSGPERNEARVVAFVDERVPIDATIALSLRANDLLFPYFGAQLDRRVQLLDETDAVSADAAWLVAAPDHAPRACRRSWHLVLERGEWRIWERTSQDICDTAGPL